MQQVVIEDRQEQERLRQEEQLAKTAAKVRRLQEHVKLIPVKLITHH